MRGIKERLLSGAVFALVALLGILLAFMQYRWSNQLSQATTLGLADSLQMSMMNWHQDLFRDFSQVCYLSSLDAQTSSTANLRSFTHSLEEWRSVAPYPDLISQVYMVRAAAGGAELLRLNTATAKLEPSAWPDGWSRIRQRLAERGSLSNSEASRLELARPQLPEDMARSFYSAGLLAGCRFEPTLPALLHPIPRSSTSPHLEQWVVIQLNKDVLRNKVLPDLAHRYFEGMGGLGFYVAVTGGGSHQVIATSDHDFGQKTIVDADGELNVFGRALNTVDGSPLYVFHGTSADKAIPSSRRIPWFPLFAGPPSNQDWLLYVRHRRGGPLGVFTAELHQRDLALSFGILVLLVASIGMLMITARRAQTLAKLQMDFVTNVSHELRTPLTVISSAADNIARGVVDGKQHVIQYGNLIQTQAERLSALVEQVLLFAATRQQRPGYALQPVDVACLVETAIVHSLALAPSSHVTLERDIAANLEPVLGDAALLSQCVQNLINNALKYGGEGNWLGVFARQDPVTNEIEISVADRGIGIAAADLPHIFEPFYRSQSVRLAQMRGTGVGLALAKNIAELMNGRLGVKSSLGKGSVFTLYLPCATTSGGSPGCVTG